MIKTITLKLTHYLTTKKNILLGKAEEREDVIKQEEGL